MFILFLFLLLTSVHATTGEIRVASLDEQRLQDLKKRLNFDDLVGGMDTFDRLALKETFEQTPTTIPPLFHYIWVGGPLYEEYWSSITRLAMLFKKSHSAARVVVWVDDLKNLEFLKVKQIDGGFLVKRNHSLSMYKPVLDVRKIDELSAKKPDFFIKEQYAEYWNIINVERHGLRNLGAVSDMVRLEVLRQYGGIYLDTDMPSLFFNVDSLPPSLFRVPLNFQIIDRSNCLIISTPHHPLLKAMMRHVLISYVDNFLQIQEKRRTDRPLKSVADRKTNKRFSLTIKISGPGAFYNSLMSKTVNPFLRLKLILPIQEVLVLPYILLPREFYAMVGHVLASGMFGDIPTETEEKMEDFIAHQKRDPFIDSNSFLITVLGLFKGSLSAPKVNPRILKTCVGLLPPILDRVQKQSVAPVLQIPQGPLDEDVKSVSRLLGFMIDHFQGVKLEYLNKKSTVARFGKMDIVRIFGCLNFRFDCHNTWVGDPYVPPAFDDWCCRYAQ